ncbi:hypothetical protein PT974_07787 [Cladobotryum mycophilum]|uniref:AB hydrolase-1 domain-containing protein n=1 Tax=Cladobotryum mycophilum TaxID=491253 RepID=A0ABR0SHX9_9HYPO
MATYETAEPQYIEVNGTRFAYLRFGSSATTAVPLVFLMHFRGSFDHWDPELINPIAAVRPVILIDNAGIGKSSGAIPDTFAKYAQNVIDISKALSLTQIDVLGFSIGGFVAQLVTLNAPSLVRRLILAGTGPSAGEGVESGDLQAFGRLATTVGTDQELLDGVLAGFFSSTPEKVALGYKWWKRMTEARPNRSDYLAAEGTKAQIDTIVRWSTPDYASEGSYNRLHEITVPVLVANGDNDIIVPTNNSWLLFKKLTNADAHLHLYPGTGHGFLYEYADQFSKLINTFLDA